MVTVDDRHFCDLYSACSSGSVRLIGGPNNSSGIVQVCSSSLWGLIAEPGWSDANAAVVCRQLQFSDEGKRLPFVVS